MEFIQSYFFEVGVALLVAGFTWGFASWSRTLRETSEKIIRKLEAMAIDIHNHRIESTESFARLDERVKALENHNANHRQDRAIAARLPRV